MTMQRKPSKKSEMFMRYRSIIPFLVALSIGGPAAAHHSGAMFDRDKTVTLSGTIKAFQYNNPHCWLTVVVPGAGGAAPAEWAIEGNTPVNMRKYGMVPSV